MEKQDENNRITLSIAFIAIYLTLIFGLLNLISLDESFIGRIVYWVIIINGISIIFSFFSFILFSALALDFSIKKRVFFELEIGEKKLEKLKRTFYNTGVSQVFFSSTYILYVICISLQRHFNFYWTTGILVSILIILIIVTIFVSILKD